MKNHLLLVVMMIAVIFSSFAQKSSLNGHVKRLLETEASNNKYSDGTGYVSMVETIEINYDDKKQKILKIRTSYKNDEPNQTQRSNFLYNNGQLILEKVSIIEDSTFYVKNYVYEGDKCLNWNSEYIFKNKKINAGENYLYDINKKLIQVDYFYIESDLETNAVERDLKSQMTYNKNEKLIESNWLKSDSTFKNNRYVFFRNDKDKIIEEREYNKHDKHDKLVKMTEFKWEYDEMENWILRKSYENNILINTVYREIEYYD